ncbi:hypothetical protein SM007_32335 [Streptomyces avermitilis]|uniref:Uncharacterized protein n=1 Tax=Streptomyces avermitilis TaxID=33903 RepID=A0A4D4N3N5_STRAX|nr:hypothetical protein SM007_32335 [Streptomyces avermitilis]BBJ48746.1 hypothetical protein SAVMC3_13750 [Streptomyces avermitilis]GDY60782.1 hypothetical protein SAV14893_001750 [Streptomyces avermitilis]GDY79141.1 hypothetical protein SAV31267_086260 [Streptomyces avermitilis]GDY88023.1 hypothetical protein SAVCW2_72220 [Streptomyces avermitilis]
MSLPLALRKKVGDGNDRDPTHARYRPDRPMTAARVPGLILPLAFLCVLVIGVFWYWRHRGD